MVEAVRAGLAGASSKCDVQLQEPQVALDLAELGVGGDASRDGGPVQRYRACCERFTLRTWWRTISTIDSIGLVDSTVSRSDPIPPSWFTGSSRRAQCYAW